MMEYDDLVRRLREGRSKGSYLTWTVTDSHKEAADAIEAMATENARLRLERDHANDCADAAIAGQHAAEAEIERLREALVAQNDLLRSARHIAEREGIKGQIASTNWDAYYNRVVGSLRKHHGTVNEARAALKGEGHE